MSNIYHKLFQVENDQPIINSVLINLPTFKKLYLEDKSKSKSNYIKQLAYIWYLCDIRSPYYNVEEKEIECKKGAFGNENESISSTLQECIEEYKKRNSTSESRSIDGAILALDNITGVLNEQKKNHTQLSELVSYITYEIDNTNDLNKKIALYKERISLEKEVINNMDKITSMIPKVMDLSAKIAEARNKINKIADDIDNSKSNISSFITDKLIQLGR